MPPFIMKLFLNKYVLGGVFLGVLSLYVYHLKTSNEELQIEVALLNENVQDYIGLIENNIKELNVLELTLRRDCEARIDIVENRKVSIGVLKSETKRTANMEKVDEKDVLGSKLPVVVLDRLRINPL